MFGENFKNMSPKEVIRCLEEIDKKRIKFIEDNSDILHKKIYSENSDIDLLNEVGKYASSKYYDVVYFKTKEIPMFGEEFKIVDLHYIHIYNKEGCLCISIFCDNEGGTMSSMYRSHYELYDTDTVKIYFKNEENALLNKVKELIN